MYAKDFICLLTTTIAGREAIPLHVRNKSFSAISLIRPIRAVHVKVFLFTSRRSLRNYGIATAIKIIQSFNIQCTEAIALSQLTVRTSFPRQRHFTFAERRLLIMHNRIEIIGLVLSRTTLAFIKVVCFVLWVNIVEIDINVVISVRS